MVIFIIVMFKNINIFALTKFLSTWDMDIKMSTILLIFLGVLKLVIYTGVSRCISEIQYQFICMY